MPMADDDDVKSVVYIQSSGVDTPQRAATPFFLAATAAAMEWDVKIYFTINGPTLLKKGVAENLYVKKDGKNGGGAPLSHFIAQARDLGVELLCCQPSLDLNDLDYEELIDGVRMIGGAAFNSLAAKASAVVCF
ncbi:MAG: uncharacterized protein QOE72_1865 [Chloroflexota bacterium]|jgi:predicted peroxiredoxin|nr:uncharacterized protein [Chloroflexota bacterium]